MKPYNAVFFQAIRDKILHPNLSNEKHYIRFIKYETHTFPDLT